MAGRSLESLVAFHCAPTLAGIKPANLFTWHHMSEQSAGNTIDMMRSKLATYDVSMDVLCMCERYALLLVYRADLMRKVFTAETEKFMAGYGYPTSADIASKIEFLKTRIAAGGDFPHEIGIFLGYPLVDVKGFIEKHGTDFKAGGFWKIYGDKDKTLALFDSYRRCTEFFCKKLESGCDITQLLSKLCPNKLEKRTCVAPCCDSGCRTVHACI